MSKRFNYRQYREDLIKKYVKKYGSKDKAILGLYSDYRAQKLLKDTVSKMVDWIGSLKLKADTLSEMVDWEQIEKEIDDEEKASQAQSA